MNLNKLRRERGKHLLKTISLLYPGDPESSLTDALADLCHATKNPKALKTAARLGAMHYDHERTLPCKSK